MLGGICAALLSSILWEEDLLQMHVSGAAFLHLTHGVHHGLYSKERIELVSLRMFEAPKVASQAILVRTRLR